MFNRLGLQKPGIVLNLDSDKKGVGGNAVAGNETEVPSKSNPSKEHTTLSTNGISVDTLGKEHVDTNASLVKLKQNSSLRENPASSVGVEIGEMPLNNNEMENVSIDHTKSRSEVIENKDSKAFLEEKAKSAKDCGDLEDRPAKKAKFEGSIKVSDDKNERNMRKLSVNVDGNDPKALATITASEDKPTLKLAEDSQGAEKRPSKEVPDEKTKHSNGKLLEASQRQSPDVDKKMDHQIMEVARRTDVVSYFFNRIIGWIDSIFLLDVLIDKLFRDKVISLESSSSCIQILCALRSSANTWVLPIAYASGSIICAIIVCQGMCLWMSFSACFSFFM
jgi:hypothetical protein